MHMKCLAPHSALLKSHRLLTLSGHSSACRQSCRHSCRHLEACNAETRRIPQRGSVMATRMERGTFREVMKGSLNARSARSSMPIFHRCQGLRQRGSPGRCFSTHVETTSGAASMETKETAQRSPFAPRIRIRQIKVGLITTSMHSTPKMSLRLVSIVCFMSLALS